MSESIKFTVLKDVEPTEVEAKLLGPESIWISKDPYHLWNETKEYECDDLYGKLADRFKVIVTSEWWPYDEEDEEMTARDANQYPPGDYPKGYWAFCKDLSESDIIQDALGLTVWLEPSLEAMHYVEGTYEHYLFELGRSILFKLTKGRKGTNYCPTHTSYYRWCQVNDFFPNPCNYD